MRTLFIAFALLAGCGELLPGERLALLQTLHEMPCGAPCPDGARCRYASDEGRSCLVACDGTSISSARLLYGERAERNDAANICPASSYTARACAPVTCDAAVTTCVGRGDCTIPINNRACGDPCPGCWKRATLEIVCAPRAVAIERACGEPCAQGETCRYQMPGARPLEGQTCQIACAGGTTKTVISTIEAEYGAWSEANPGFRRCERDRYRAQQCRAIACPASVAACSGKAGCEVRLDNRACDDPCRDCIKSGAVTIRCEN